MPFQPVSLIEHVGSANEHGQETLLPGERWIPVIEHPCDFDPKRFVVVCLNLTSNPNIVSSHLFRADILYDSQEDELTNASISAPELRGLQETYGHESTNFPGFEVQRTLIRKLIPRNPQLDKPITQSCIFLRSRGADGEERNVHVLMPHASSVDSLPWYHPAVRAIAYWHSWKPIKTTASGEDGIDHATGTSNQPGKVSIHYQLFPGQEVDLNHRLLRIAHNMLSVLYKHGENSDYQKRVHHDQLVSQKRVQDTYTELKARHAERLRSNWVEETEPSKHIFEDLGIAAFLIELWKDMYAPLSVPPNDSKPSLPPFPGFVDLGCGNGVLTDILILSGYKGYGFDARRRKTWSILSPKTQANLHETLCVPQPLFDIAPPVSPSPRNQPLLARPIRWFISKTLPSAQETSSLIPPTKPWHNGLFPPGTFIISNHADELTPWTPLLASLSHSPFLAIPCCSHNLSGDRFRAPSAFNSNTADAAAPGYFAAQKSATRAKSVPISIPAMEPGGGEAEDAGHGDLTASTSPFNSTQHPPTSTSTSTAALPTPIPTPGSRPAAAETGDLKRLSAAARAKQPSAYSSLCSWVEYLAREAGYVVEREMLRIPSTRNVGIVGRTWTDGGAAEGSETETETEIEGERERNRRERVLEIVRREGADGKKWIARCEGVLAKASANEGHGLHAR